MSGKVVFGGLINEGQLPQEASDFSRQLRLKVTVKEMPLSLFEIFHIR